MISQDTTGAVFLAIDSETDREVFLQRFFPFGAEEGGLQGDELIAYGQAVERMKALDHPNLRRIIDGGCDPVDGMPYLVTEARRDANLRDYCANAALTVAQGHLFVESALALMLDLEKTFGQVADWLALQADDIEVIGEVERFRFCMDPMKWLGLRQGPGTVKELALLAEQAMGWSGKVFTGSQAGLFSGWLRTAKSQTLTPSDAWELLRTGKLPAKATASVATVMPTMHAPAAPVNPVTLASAKGGGATVWIVFGTIAAVACIAVAFVILKAPPEQPAVAVAAAAPAPKAPSPVITRTSAVPRAAAEGAPRTLSQEDAMREQIERRAVEMQKQAAATTPPNKNRPATQPAAGPKAPKKPEYMPGEMELITQQKGEEIVVVAPISKVKLSTTGKTLYIEFSGGATERIIGRHLTNLGAEGMSVSELGGLEGKRVRVRGKVAVEFGSNRIILDIISRDQITEEPAP